MKLNIRIDSRSFFCTLGIILLIVSAGFSNNVWFWGGEGLLVKDETYDYFELINDTYKKPEGMLGCQWFNYGNEWGIRPVIFPGWDTAYESERTYCFEGSFSTIMLHYQWPKQSSFSGILGKKPVYIDNNWQYDAIKDFSDGEKDDPESRILPVCNTLTSCSVADEIARLYIAVRAACNYDDDYHILWDPESKFCDILRTRFGFVNVKTGKLLDTEVFSRVIENLDGNDGNIPQPIIAFNDNHMVVVDGYRVLKNELGEQTYEFHTLDYKNSYNRHWSYWAPLDDYEFDNVIYDLRPDIELPVGITRNFDFSVGNDEIPQTSGTKRRGSFYLSPVNVNGADVSVKVYLSVLNNQKWENDTLIASDHITINAKGVETTPFYYNVPENSSIKIRLELTNEQYPSTVILRTVLYDSAYTILVLLPEDTATAPEKLSLLYPNDKTEFLEVSKEFWFQWKSWTDENIQLVPYVTIDSGRTLIAISTHSISSTIETFNWFVPETLMTLVGPIPLIGRTIGFYFKAYNDEASFIKTNKYIPVISYKSAIAKPVRKSIIKVEPIIKPTYNLLGRRLTDKAPKQSASGLVLQHGWKVISQNK